MEADDREELLEKIRALEDRVEEAEGMLTAIRNGEVDAIVVSGATGERVYTLEGADEAYRILIEEMAEGAVTVTPDGLILFANERFAAMLRVPLKNVIGARIQNVIAPEEAAVLSALLTTDLQNPASAELRLKADDGTLVPVYATASPIHKGDLGGICLMLTDLTEQKRNEQIVAAEKLASSILEQAAEAILVVDPEGRIIRSSRATELLAGGPVLLRQFDEVFRLRFENTEYSFQHILSTLLQGKGLRGVDSKATVADGRMLQVLVSAAPLLGAGGELLGYVVTLADITDRKRAEERLRDAQKLESIGLLAGGIAHDFNNLLTSIMGNASLLQSEPPFEGNANLRAILRATERAANLTRQLLAYAGKGQFAIEKVDLSSTVRDITELLQTSIPKNVLLRQELPVDLPAVEADPGQIQQVVMNLVLNAAEAIPEDRPGAISIRTTTEEVRARDGLFDEVSHEAVAPGTYVCLEVRDNGVGLDEGTRAKIFEPFFTTKFVGRGLGLPAAAGVVKAHGGAILVSSAVGEGTTFRILLPAVERGVEEERATAGDLRGAGTVLVVDDEQMVRDMATAALEKFGYRVLSAKDGREAIGVFQKNGDCISAVLLDLTMPVMGGEQALEALKEKCPGVKVVLMSGYGESEAVRLFAGKGLSAFIQKPFTVRQLAEKMKAVLTVRLEPWP